MRAVTPQKTEQRAPQKLPPASSRLNVSHPQTPLTRKNNRATDLEAECDGFLNYDRSAKFSAAEAAQVKACNAALVASVRARG